MWCMQAIKHEEMYAAENWNEWCLILLQCKLLTRCICQIKSFRLHQSSAFLGPKSVHIFPYPDKLSGSTDQILITQRVISGSELFYCCLFSNDCVWEYVLMAQCASHDQQFQLWPLRQNPLIAWRCSWRLGRNKTQRIHALINSQCW